MECFVFWNWNFEFKGAYSYTKRQITALTFLPLTNNCPHFFLPLQNNNKNHLERQNSLILKVTSEFKGQIVSKSDLDLLNAYNLMYVDKVRAVICLV